MTSFQSLQKFVGIFVRVFRVASVMPMALDDDQVELSVNRSCISNSQCSTTNLRHLHYIHLAISKTRAYFTYISWLHDKLTTITAPKDYKITAHIYIELMILTIIKINASINVQNLNEKLYMLS